MGMVWMKDIMARKPKPMNTSPGPIYMLNGATQHSFTDPFDTTSPAIPIGPHWMILWPFDAKAAGLSAVMRDGARWSCSPVRPTPICTFAARLGMGMNITRVIAVCGP